MKKLLFFILFPLLTFGQDSPVNFQSNKNWNNITQLAKQSNKYIFVDCYATWCEPCKYMDQKVLTQNDVSNFLNTNFINWKLQFDQTANDSEEIKSLYEEAARFKDLYDIRVFPTYLIFDQSGALVHRIVGGSEAAGFLTKLKDGLNPETQYERLISTFNADRSNLEILKKVLDQAQRNQDVDRSNIAIQSLIQTLGIEKTLVPEYMPYIINSGRNSSSYSYKLIRDHKESFDSYLSPQKMNTNQLLSAILIYELVLPKMQSESDKDLNFDKLQSEIEKEHPYVDLTSMMNRAKIQYYSSKGKWSEMIQAVDASIVLDGGNINTEELKAYAQMLMKASTDNSLTDKAKGWIEIADGLKK